LLQRISDIVKVGGESLSGGSFKLIEPLCTRTRTKSTWQNFASQADALDRDGQHILDFFLSELGCEGNIGS
jgi:translation initiation factor 2 beta subunit (eIF-2beta)/eIF-5